MDLCGKSSVVKKLCKAVNWLAGRTTNEGTGLPKICRNVSRATQINRENRNQQPKSGRRSVLCCNETPMFAESNLHSSATQRLRRK